MTFDGQGKYSDPEFVSKQTIGPTALKFLNSDKLRYSISKYYIYG